MNKTISSVIIGTLLLPSLLFAQEMNQQPPREQPKRPLREQKPELFKKEAMEGRMKEMKDKRERATTSREMLAKGGFCQGLDTMLAAMNTAEKKGDKMKGKDVQKKFSDIKQREMVISFQEGMSNALIMREEGMKKIKEDRTEKTRKASSTERAARVEQALTTFKTSIEAAKTRAKNDCTSGVEGMTVHKNLKNDMEKAHETLRRTLQENKPDDKKKPENAKNGMKKMEDEMKAKKDKMRSDVREAFRKDQRATTTVR